MIMQRAKSISMGESSQRTGTPAVRRNSGQPGCAYVPPPRARTVPSLSSEARPRAARKLIGFDLAKCRFAEAFENLRNGKAGGFFDARIEIDEAPGQLTSQERADSGLAGAHEAGKT